MLKNKHLSSFDPALKVLYCSTNSLMPERVHRLGASTDESCLALLSVLSRLLCQSHDREQQTSRWHSLQDLQIIALYSFCTESQHVLGVRVVFNAISKKHWGSIINTQQNKVKWRSNADLEGHAFSSNVLLDPSVVWNENNLFNLHKIMYIYVYSLSLSLYR